MREHGNDSLHGGAATPTADWDARYSERDGLMWSGRPNGRLVAEIGDLRPGRALDVGCGEGADAIWLAGRGWVVTAIDISHVAVGRARAAAELAGATVEWICGDALHTELPNRSFDLVSMQYPALPKGRRRIGRSDAARHSAPWRVAARRLPRPRPRPSPAHEVAWHRPCGLRRRRRPQPTALRRLHSRAARSRAAHRPAARHAAHRRHRAARPPSRRWSAGTSPVTLVAIDRRTQTEVMNAGDVELFRGPVGPSW